MSLQDEISSALAQMGRSQKSSSAAAAQSSKTIQHCKHNDIVEDDGVSFCNDCGCEVQVLGFDAEWRHYPADGASGKGDPSRCHSQSSGGRGGIEKMVSDLRIELHDATMKKLIERYEKVIEGNVRGTKRKAIVAVCLQHIFREDKNIVTAGDICKMFKLKNQQLSKGASKYLATFPETNLPNPTPRDLIPNVMKKVGIPDDHEANLVLMAQTIDRTHKELIRGGAEPVAAAVIFVYISSIKHNRREKFGMTKQKFVQDVGFTEITIVKLATIVAEVLKLTNKINLE